MLQRLLVTRKAICAPATPLPAPPWRAASRPSLGHRASGITALHPGGEIKRSPFREAREHQVSNAARGCDPQAGWGAGRRFRVLGGSIARSAPGGTGCA